MTLIERSGEETGHLMFQHVQIKASCLLLIINTLCENAHIHTDLCFLPLKRTDIETKKTLKNFVGHIKASQKDEPVSAATVTYR